MTDGFDEKPPNDRLLDYENRVSTPADVNVVVFWFFYAIASPIGILIGLCLVGWKLSGVVFESMLLMLAAWVFLTIGLSLAVRKAPPRSPTAAKLQGAACATFVWVPAFLLGWLFWRFG